MYVRPNVKSKAELKRHLKAGKRVTVYANALGTIPFDGTVELEGPHYPQHHTWYAMGTMRGGKLVSVR